MLLARKTRRRRGATVVESALVYPIAFLLVIGLIVAAFGVFRYQEVASVAREGARWASVHGYQCCQEANPNTTPPPLTQASDVYTNAIKPQADAANLDPPSLGYSVTWADPSESPVYYNSTTGAWSRNTVTVTITYQWIPEGYMGGITLTSTSIMPITY